MRSPLLGLLLDAFLGWLARQFPPAAPDPAEQLPDDHPDAAPPVPRPPAPPRRKPILPKGDDWLKRLMKGRKPPK